MLPDAGTMMPIGAPAIFRSVRATDGDRDFLGYHWRIEVEVLGVTEHQLQRVFAGWQFNTRFGLPGAEMKMLFVLWDRLVWVKWFVYVDQQMMMTAVWGEV